MRPDRSFVTLRMLVGLLVVWSLVAVPARGAEFSLRFFGNGVAAPGLDRVEIALDAPPRPVDVGGDFSLELWLKVAPGENGTATCSNASDAWILGNIVLDRDVFGDGDFGDWGVSLMNGRVAFGVHNGTTGATLCGSTDLADQAWHFLALTRRASDGRLQLYVDGQLEATFAGPLGDLSYRDGRTGFPKDPYLVLGAEKHDAGAEYPSFSGWLDDLRITAALTWTTSGPPPTEPAVAVPGTVALYSCNEGGGTALGDSSQHASGPSPGVLQVGGSPAGPQFVPDSPFGPFADGFESGTAGAWSAATG